MDIFLGVSFKFEIILGRICTYATENIISKINKTKQKKTNKKQAHVYIIYLTNIQHFMHSVWQNPPI